jgi:hypothetical protein
LPETGLENSCIDPAADKRRDSIRLSSHLHDRDLVANRIQTENLQRDLSSQMTARAKGADGDSFSFQICWLAHLGQDPKLIRHYMDGPRQDHEIGSRPDGARRGTYAGGSHFGLTRDQGLRRHGSTAGKNRCGIETMLFVKALIFRQPNARMRGDQPRVRNQKLCQRFLRRTYANPASQQRHSQAYLDESPAAHHVTQFSDCRHNDPLL